MKALFRYQAKGSRGVVDIELVGEIPFVPQSCTMLKLTPGGDYLKVDDVYWDATNPGQLEIFIEECAGSPLWPLAEMKAEGWRVTR